MDSYLGSNHNSWEKKLTFTYNASGSDSTQTGRLADKIQLDFKILKTLYRLNHLDCYFVYSNAMLLIVLEVHFSLFSQT